MLNGWHRRRHADWELPSDYGYLTNTHKNTATAITVAVDLRPEGQLKKIFAGSVQMITLEDSACTDGGNCPFQIKHVPRVAEHVNYRITKESFELVFILPLCTAKPIRGKGLYPDYG